MSHLAHYFEPEVGVGAYTQIFC